MPAVARLLDGARSLNLPLRDNFSLENIAIWLARLEPPQQRVFVIAHGEEIVAMMILEEKIGETEVSYIVTSIEHQRQGYGRCLLRLAKQSSGAAEVVTARIQPINGPVIGLLASEGFAEDARINEKHRGLPGGWRWYSYRL